MDAAKKERWRQRDARRKEKQRHKQTSIVTIKTWGRPATQYAVDSKELNRAMYFALRPKLYFDGEAPAPVRIDTAYQAVIDSDEYKQAIAGTRNMTELNAVRRRFGTL